MPIKYYITLMKSNSTIDHHLEFYISAWTLKYFNLCSIGLSLPTSFQLGTGTPGAVVVIRGAAGGFRCLAEGHLIRGRGRRRVLHNYSSHQHYFAFWSGFEPATFRLPVQLLNQSNMHI